MASPTTCGDLHCRLAASSSEFPSPVQFFLSQHHPELFDAAWEKRQHPERAFGDFSGPRVRKNHANAFADSAATLVLLDFVTHEISVCFS
jgi:hypothetical protein